MRQLPPRARVFVLGTIVLGAGITAAIPYLPGGLPPLNLHVLIFLAAALVAQLVGVRWFMPGLEGQAWSLISAVLIPSIILFPPATVVIIVLITFAAYAVKRRSLPWYQNAWNIAQHEVAVLVAALVWGNVRPASSGGWLAVHWYAAAFFAGAAFYLLNNLQTNTVLALATGRPFRQVGIFSRVNFSRELVLTWLGVVIADLWLVNPWRTVLLIVPLIGLSQMLRSQVEDAQRIRRAQVEAEGRAQQLSSLNELSRALTSSLDFDQVFDALYAQLAKTVTLDVLSIALLDPHTNQLEFHVMKAGQGMLPTIVRRAEAPELRGLLAARTPLVLMPARHRDTVEAVSPHGVLLETAAVTVVPMTLAERTVGLMLLGTREPPLPAHLDLVSTMASQVAVAAEKVELFQRERRKTAQLSAITQVSKKIVTIHNVDVLLQQTSRLIEESFGFARVEVALHTDGAAPAPAEGAAADIPIFYRDQTIGVMRVWLHPGTVLSADDLSMLQTLADEIAVAIENARLYGQTSESLQQTVAELRAANAQLAYLSSLAIGAQEEERRRLARELHDGTAQELATLLVRLRVLERTEEPRELRLRLSEFREVIARALDDVRRMALDLRPTMLDDLGLVPALEAHTRDMARRWGIAVRLETQGLDRRLPGQTELVAYRIVQEALSNIFKHSQATEATVTLVLQGRELRITVRDNGRGFDVGRTLASRERGLGLFGMQERAALVGGHLELASAPGAGTRVTASLPVRELVEGRETP